MRPKRLYACTAWDPYFKKDVEAIERVQRNAARFCTGQYDQTASVTSMLQGLNWDTLETMRKRERLVTMYKMCHGYLEGNWGEYLIPNNEKRTRGSHQFKFRIPKARINVFKYSFFPRTISEWNKLQLTLLLLNLLTFLKTAYFKN